MFRKFVVASALALAVFGGGGGYVQAAESREWKSDPPKQGIEGFSLCIGYAEAGGHSYQNTNYIDNEILANCDRYAREDVVRGFRFMYGIDLDPAAVQVTIRQP